MRFPTRSLSVALLSLTLVAGCEVAAGPVGPPDAVAVEPGYYYDEEYVDVGGYHHPREYWYHDDHGWSHRDAVPHGFTARSRASVGYPHGGGDEHGGGEHGGGEHGGGGGGHGGR